MKLSILAATCLLFHASLFADEEADKTTIVARAKTMVDATLKGDANEVLKFMPPAVIQAMGGEATFRQAIAKTVADMKQIGMEYLSMDILPPEKFHHGGSRTFAVVKTKSVMLVPGKARITEESSMIAIQDQPGAEWTFLRINEAIATKREILKRLLPDFPDDVKLDPPPRPQTTPVEK